MDTDMEDETFPLLTLLHRTNDVDDELPVSVETTLFQSNVTGHYLIEQIQSGRHGTKVNTISFGPALIAEFLPLLTEIAER